jgi:hypothetical protein
MNSAAVDVADMLVADTTIGLTIATNLFVGKEPTKPDNVVTIYDSYGYPPQLTFDPQNERYEYPTIQVRVRNRDYRTGYNLAHKILDSLHGRAQQSCNGTLYTVIYSTSGVALMDWEDTGLCRFLVNFNLQRR